MKFRSIVLILYILQYIASTNGQNVLPTKQVDICALSTTTLSCPMNYAIIVKSVFLGVPQISGKCSYSPGDCIADAMDIIFCYTDNINCDVYAPSRKLPQCRDQTNTYAHIEYDCVPIAMNNSAFEYNICQSSASIVSDNGIIKSPGYPTQFQTTSTECFRSIQVPQNKTIRLWLTDLYIPSLIGSCDKDHAYVVDSIQTYRHCGGTRFAYPYLCSSTIIIQYYISTQSQQYRGMRMYFEIVDRPQNDGCPNPSGTLTPIPLTTPPTTFNPFQTTSMPPYAILGIASPVESFQLCQGSSYTIQCPNDYGAVIRKNVFGVTESGQCEQYDASKHCVTTTPPTFSCRQRCTLFYPGNQLISSCSNRMASYQYVEYQCIPIKAPILPQPTSCPTDGATFPIQIDRRGRLLSTDYPNLKLAECTYRLRTDADSILNIYAVDISLNGFLPDCDSNKISFVEDGDTDGPVFCEQRYSISLIYSSCSNVLDMVYMVTDDTVQLSSGFDLYIESQVRPTDWVCGKPVETTTPITTRTTPLVTQSPGILTNETNMFARDEVERDICFGSTMNEACPSGYTFMITSAFYGVKAPTSTKCGFVPGDCTQEALSTITACRNDQPRCYLSYSTKRRLALCSDNYADYLHLTTQCVPSNSVGNISTVAKFDICDTNNPIQDINGVVTSPNFPTYKQTNTLCRRTIRGLLDRVIKIWINEMAIPAGVQRDLNHHDEHSSEPDVVIYKNADTEYSDNLEDSFPSIRDTCTNDYLIIDAPHVAYVYCGTRKLVMAPICTVDLTIQYKTISSPSFLYKGFKLYYEWIPKMPPDLICPGLPQGSTTTVPVTEVPPIWAENLEVSPLFSQHICLGASATLKCPRGSDYALAIVESNYAVTGTGSCDLPSPSHCRQEASLGLTCTQSCFIEYIIAQPLSACQSQYADYLNIDYECIPTRLPNNENPFDICGTSSTSTIALNKVMMISPQYPTLGPARTCSKRIEAPSNKIWLVYIVDLFLEAPNDVGICNAASLTINDGKDIIVQCGLQVPQLVLVSCGNILEFKFVSTHQAIGYRGFKIYAQTIDVPNNWACVPINFTTTTRTTTTRRPTTTSVIPPSLQIPVYGGTTMNVTGQFCQLPFIYQGRPQSSCLMLPPPGSTSGQITDGQDPWCSLTSNFDTDGKWGFCDTRVTDSTIYDICRAQQQTLRCPPGYAIDILTADYAAKPDGNIGPGACVYDQNDCFQSDASTVQATCAGRTSCAAYHFAKPLATCQNRPSAYLHIDYTCVPYDNPSVTTYNLCNSTFVPQANTRRGFIVSPSFPILQNNFDCTFNLQTVKPFQDIYLYVLDMDLNNANGLGQGCVKDRLIISADNNILEMCGRSYTNFLLNSCHSSVTIQLIRAADARGRGVKFYFEFRDRSPQDICPELITTTSTMRPNTTRATTSTTSPVPLDSVTPSPRYFKTLCFPDLSGLFGANNFQCPPYFVLVILRAFYGASNRCDFIPGDCTSEADTVYRTCSGKQKCSVPFTNQVTLPECGTTARYLFVEYQCLPTPPIVANKAELCSSQIDVVGVTSGIFTSLSYPSYTQTQCLNVTLSSIPGTDLVIFFYLLDLSIGSSNPSTGECSNDYLELSYQCNNELFTRRLCDTRSTELLFSTCSSTDKIFASYSLLSSAADSQRGFALLYHLIPVRDVSTTISTISTTRTTSSASTMSTTAAGPGSLSTPIQMSQSCVQQSITVRCNQPGYVLVLHKVQLAASATGSCSFSPNDCFEDRINSYNTCGGKISCFIFPPLIPLRSCNNSRSNYLYVEHQCIPVRPKLNLDLCASTGSIQRVQGGAIISSLNYTPKFKDCKVQLQSNPLLGSLTHKAFKIYILSLNLPITSTIREQGSQCSDDDPYIEINDFLLGTTRLCGNSHTRYLFETCSNTIDIRYINHVLNIGTVSYKGFEIYVESIENEQCRPIPPTMPPTSPFVISNYSVCALSNGNEGIRFSCTPGFGLVFLQSYHFGTKQPDQCDLTDFNCFYPSEQPQTQCAGQQECTYTVNMPISPAINPCQADSTRFHFQCLPMKPSLSYSTVQFCLNSETSETMGFIETPNYPNSYQNGKLQCSLTIRIPDNMPNGRYSIFLYVIELSLRDGTSANPPSDVDCLDSIQYMKGESVYSLCGKVDQPALEYYTDGRELKLTFAITDFVPPSQWSQWHGARLFYMIDNQTIPSLPGSTGSTTTTATTVATDTTSAVDKPDGPKKKKPNHGGLIAGIIIAVLVIVGGVVGYVLYRRHKLSKSSYVPSVTYGGTGMVTVDGLSTNGSAKTRGSIPAGSLKGPATTGFISPFYKKSETNTNSETENTTDA